MDKENRDLLMAIMSIFVRCGIKEAIQIIKYRLSDEPTIEEIREILRDYERK